MRKTGAVAIVAGLVLIGAATPEADAASVSFAAANSPYPDGVTLTIDPSLTPQSFSFDLVPAFTEFSDPPPTGPGIVPPPDAPDQGTLSFAGSYRASVSDTPNFFYGDPPLPAFTIDPGVSGGLSGDADMPIPPALTVTVTYDPAVSLCLSDPDPCFYLRVFSTEDVVFWQTVQTDVDESMVFFDSAVGDGEFVVPIFVQQVPVPAGVALMLPVLALFAAFRCRAAWAFMRSA